MKTQTSKTAAVMGLISRGPASAPSPVAGDAASQTERTIDEITADILRAQVDGGRAVLTIGNGLIEAKGKLNHGEWLPWLTENVGYSEKQAENYMKIARSYSNPQLVADLGMRNALSLLALTGWTVQWRVYKSGVQRLHMIPSEAYVFGAHDCVQLLGWRNGYSRTTGYFIQYANQWSQPPTWKERWGREENIFGLTEDLIDRSCLPHCKLDVYMQSRPGSHHYPVAYLRLYQSHPNVEAVLLHGLPAVLDGLIDG